MTEQLQTSEIQRLMELENIVSRHLETFTEVGNALLEIRDSRLYRESFTNFEDYCRTRWGMTRRRADQLIEAAEVVENMPEAKNGNNCSKTTAKNENNCSQIINEGQARELAKVPIEDRPAVLEAAAANGKVTAKAIREAAKAAKTEPTEPTHIVTADEEMKIQPIQPKTDQQQFAASYAFMGALARIAEEVTEALGCFPDEKHRAKLLECLAKQSLRVRDWRAPA